LFSSDAGRADPSRRRPKRQVLVMSLLTELEIILQKFFCKYVAPTARDEI
jgi:hypothetical protein